MEDHLKAAAEALSMNDGQILRYIRQINFSEELSALDLAVIDEARTREISLTLPQTGEARIHKGTVND